MLIFLDSRTGHRNIIQVKAINDLFICEECRNVLPYNVILSFDNGDGYYLGVIGAILGKNVKGVGGVFPHEYVRKLLEEYDSKDIDREIAYSFEGISRGRTVEDGKKEREKAKEYKEMASALQVEYPHSARMVKMIAEVYERNSKQ